MKSVRWFGGPLGHSTLQPERRLAVTVRSEDSESETAVTASAAPVTARRRSRAPAPPLVRLASSSPSRRPPVSSVN